MKYCVLIFLSIVLAGSLNAQAVLPKITVVNTNGNVVVSWKNEYKKPIVTLNVQRSYDSLRNYTTIGSVLTPQSEENGYLDEQPPYSRMYYRVFIAFEGGEYILSTPVKAYKTPTSSSDTGVINAPWLNMNRDSSISYDAVTPPPPPPKEIKRAWVPSTYMYTAPNAAIVLNLPGALTRKYRAKIFDENEKQIFELTHLKEDILLMDKVNFPKNGWYYFELYDGEVLVEKNKFFVPKDTKVTR